MTDVVKIDRRTFLKQGLAAGGGILIGVNATSCSDSSDNNKISTDNNIFSPNAWLAISTDGIITINIAEADMGQGNMTALAMLITEELDADWNMVMVKHASLDPIYGYQITGGSNSIRKAWQPLRTAGAVARTMLLEAAALKWDVPPSECVTSQSYVTHNHERRKIGYGEIATIAATLVIPDSVTLKSPSDFNLIGQSLPRLDSLSKIQGNEKYGIDTQIPGILTAAIKHCPVFGGRLVDVDSSKIENISSIKKIVKLHSAVAVIADSYWTAKKGIDALNISWDIGKNHNTSTESLKHDLTAAQTIIKNTHQNIGDSEKLLKSSNNIMEAEYDLPFQAHATMEPMNCTVHIKDGRCDVWVSTQTPSGVQNTAFTEMYSGINNLIYKMKRRLQGGRVESINIHKTAIGGGFGRRLKSDFVTSAVQIANTVNAPVKVIWSREEDIQHDFYRPANRHTMRAVFDKNNLPEAWSHHAAGPDISANNLQYEIPNTLITTTNVKTSVPTGSWRSVMHSCNAFVIESFIDELAYSAKQDPVAYRLRLLNHSPRLQHVIRLAADKSGWNTVAPDKRYRGIAAHTAFGSYIAHVAEISVSPTGRISVHKVTCAFDCGLIVNPDTVHAQIEGGIIFGLTATLKSKISIKNGRTEQSNFHDFPLLRIDETPEIETHLVNSTRSPGGVGEPPVPPVAPAVANALFSATGKRVRRLPLTEIF